MRFLLRTLPLAVLVAALAGCGGDKRASVSGKVTVGGKPLTGGNITFILVSDPNRTTSGLIKPDGSYEVSDAPVGECKVVIDNSHLDPDAIKKGGMGGPGTPAMGPPMKGPAAATGGGGPKEADKAKMGGPAKGADAPSEMGKSETTGQKYVKIDPAHTKPDSTSLRFTVERGSNTKDFEIK